MTPPDIAAVAILALTYLGVAAGGVPGLRLDRAGVAFLGGAAMIALGPMSLEEAFHAIDLNTIALLVGMMIVVAHLKVSGAFRALGGFAIEHAHAPLVLLVTITVLAGVLSAFFVNDAICLAMTPIVIEVVRALRRNPVPYLVATATASNCGSVATITGNPQNMVIGAVSKISYPAFAFSLAPVAAFGLAAVVAVVWLAFRKEFARGDEFQPHLKPGRLHAGQVGEGERRLRRAGDRPLRRRAAGGSRRARRRDPPLHPLRSSPIASIARSTGRCSSCSPASSSSSPGRRRRCSLPTGSQWRRASASTFPGASRS